MRAESSVRLQLHQVSAICAVYEQSKQVTMRESLKKKIEYSIELLRKSEKMAIRLDHENGFYLAFSGGKDSQALYHIALMAGVKFKAHMNLTSIDLRKLSASSRSNIPMWS